MNYNQKDLEKALAELSSKYPNIRGNNNKSIGNANEMLLFRNQKFFRESMKRSNFKNLTYETCELVNNSFVDSCFHSVNFSNTLLEGNAFSCSSFFDSKILNDTMQVYKSNNFSQTSFTSCTLCQSTFHSSAFLQTLFHKCTIENTRFFSSTMEGSRFINCTFENADFGNVNIEFSEFIYPKLSKVIFPFYQLPYIIGIADYLDSSSNEIQLQIGEQIISMEEYLEQIDNLILYFEDQSDYFPICNLYIMKKDLSSATRALLDGINLSLHDLDFRMIRHYCRLARHHNLLNELTTRRISNAIENYIAESNIPPERLNECIIHFGEIRNILLSEKKDGVALNLKVRTNINKDNQQGIEYVNSLCNNLNKILSQNNLGQTGFQVAVSNHSPFEIMVDVICSAGAVATIAQTIWQAIDRHRAKNNDYKEYAPLDQKIYRDYVNTRIDLCKEQLLRLKDSYSSKRMNKYIEEITQNLKTDLDALYDNDIMIFKKKNSDEN